MSSNGDVRLSFPIGLFCMATLSWTLLFALDQSVTPSMPHSSNKNQEVKPDASSASPLPARDPAPIRDHHLDHHDLGLNHDGLDEDVYWNDGSA